MARSFPVVAALAAALVAGCTSSKSPDPSCPSGQERCDQQCVDPATYYAADPVNCGGCGISCGAGTCTGGACACGGVTPTPCPGANPRCADLNADPLNCGACGAACTKPNAACVAGGCACAGSYPNDCGAYCANTQTDRRNCGGCGTLCPHTNDACTLGSCGCPAGLPDVCGGTLCVNLASDASNCGTCGHVCATGATCSGSNCVCPGVAVECGSACVDTSADEANCGACGHVCPGGATCTAGSCPCAAGPTAGCQGACCAGGSATCCGNGACETQHSNGVGQSFFDCMPLGTYDLTQALKAAKAWDPAGAQPSYLLLCASSSCLGWQTQHQCGTWCYGPPGDPLRGKASVNVFDNFCGCPVDGSPSWN